MQIGVSSIMRLSIACLFALLPLAAQTSDEKDVLAAVQKTFDGMAANDAAKILASMTADARLYGVRNGAPYAMPAEQWANRIASIKSQFIERFTKALSFREQLHAYIAQLEQRLRWSTLLRGWPFSPAALWWRRWCWSPSPMRSPFRMEASPPPASR
jgi:hypothetical protein